MKDCPLSKSDILPRNASWILERWFYKTVVKNTYQNQTIDVEIVHKQYFSTYLHRWWHTVEPEKESSQRVHMKSVNQEMFSGKDWEKI